ncbi:MAG: oxidoreductase [Leptolyngbya sp.]|nr:MAG: oxidoreductase [Leptolyngbya sp.]
MPPSSNLAEQVILITGASTGIGASLAQVLAQQYPGIRLVLAARNLEKLDAVATLCYASGSQALTDAADLAHIHQVQALAKTALNRFGQVDALVNHAGYGQMEVLELVPPEAARRQFEVTVLGPLTLIQALIPAMRDRGGGKIINISSIGGRTASPLGGLYSASKFALEALSDTLRMELQPFNIQVSVIEPSPVSTNFFEVVRQEITKIFPNPETTPDHAAFQKMEALEQQTSANAWTSERVAGAIIKALNTRRPQPRYVEATGGRFLLFFLTKVRSTRTVDRFWQRFYGLDFVAKGWKRSHQ